MTNEAFARVKIDALLAAQGWNTQDPNAVRYEVVLPDSTRADYVLCDRHGRSLAVIEAKRFSVSPGDAAAQAKAYAQHLGVPYVFLSNGFAADLGVLVVTQEDLDGMKNDLIRFPDANAFFERGFRAVQNCQSARTAERDAARLINVQGGT
jgi:type I site-specific restriction endonuclease